MTVTASLAVVAASLGAVGTVLGVVGLLDFNSGLGLVETFDRSGLNRKKTEW
jgi:hypothetical protein